VFSLFVLITNPSFSQKKILKEIKTFNETGDYQNSFKYIGKYKEKYDTFNLSYLICVADYYSIKNKYTKISMTDNELPGCPD
jgi:hypothetical protein